MKSSSGIVYLFSGAGFAERMIVAIHSMRQHYDGSVTVFVTDEDCARVISGAPELDAQVMPVEKAKYRRNAAYATKPRMPEWSPYERTLFVDGDTITVGDPRPLLEKLTSVDLVITEFAAWQSQGRRMQKRINGWRGLSTAIDRLVDSQLSREWPAINTGVLGWRRGWQYARQWATITDAGSPRHMADELAMQLLQSAMPPDSYEVVDDRWNCSPLYGANYSEAVIWHCHGRKHLRKEAGRELWVPAFEAAREANVGGLADWAGKYDRTVKQWLAGEIPK